MSSFLLSVSAEDQTNLNSHKEPSQLRGGGTEREKEGGHRGGERQKGRETRERDRGGEKIPSHQKGKPRKPTSYLPNDGQGSEMFTGAAVPLQGLVWLAEAPGPQGSVFWVTGHDELGRASIKSNKVVCCEWEPGC